MKHHSIDITIGTSEDLAAFIEVLEEAATWLWGRGIHQWAPGAIRLQRSMLRELLTAGALVTARRGERLVGGCVVTVHPLPAWSGTSDASAYLHKLVVARSVAGRDLGARIVGAAERWTRERGHDFLRLDCWDGNVRLRQYYRDLGYTELGAGSEGDYQVRLFQRAL